MKRNHFRAVVSAKTRAVLVEEGRKQYVRTCLDLPGLRDIATGGEPAAGPVMASLVTILHHIDEKLDRILEKMEEKEDGISEIEVYDTVDISGSGISLVFDQNLNTGQMLRLSIALPGYPFGRFETLGRVVRTVMKEEQGRPFYHTGIEFVDLDGAEKERLVQYTFSQQRKQIRASGNGEI